MTYMFWYKDTDKCDYLMKNSLQTVSGSYLKTSVKGAGTLPLTSLGPKCYSPVSNYLKSVYIPQGPTCLDLNWITTVELIYPLVLYFCNSTAVCFITAENKTSCLVRLCTESQRHSNLKFLFIVLHKISMQFM